MLQSDPSGKNVYIPSEESLMEPVITTIAAAVALGAAAGLKDAGLK